MSVDVYLVNKWLLWQCGMNEKIGALLNKKEQFATIVIQLWRFLESRLFFSSGMRDIVLSFEKFLFQWK